MVKNDIDDPWLREEPSQFFEQPKDTILWVGLSVGLFGGAWLLAIITGIIFNAMYR